LPCFRQCPRLDRIAPGTPAIDEYPKISNIKTSNIKTSNIMTSNIEPLAREMAERICRRSGMAEAAIPRWVELHWPCAAAMLEAGVMDEGGEWVEHRDVRLGMEAYRERLSRAK
jgi:hypothetical protein